MPVGKSRRRRDEPSTGPRSPEDRPLRQLAPLRPCWIPITRTGKSPTTQPHRFGNEKRWAAPPCSVSERGLEPPGPQIPRGPQSRARYRTVSAGARKSVFMRAFVRRVTALPRAAGRDQVGRACVPNLGRERQLVIIVERRSGLRSELIEVVVSPEIGIVSAILDCPERAHSLFVLGHGSGSTMRVPFMAGLSEALTSAGVATFRFEYPYSDRQDFVPYSDLPTDADDVLVATIRAAVEAAATAVPHLPLFAGGHSVSGLLTSVTNSETPIPHVRGVIMLGFPLKGAMENAAHLSAGTTRLLFVQGTSDALGDAGQIQQVTDSIGARATLRTVESASHGFSVPGRQDGDVYAELSGHISGWMTQAA